MTQNVKRLEWSEADHMVQATGLLGIYTCYETINGDWVSLFNRVPFLPAGATHRSADEAKAAAQADFESRILVAREDASGAGAA